MEITVDKALNELWLDDALHQEIRWDVEGLKPWTGKDSLSLHVGSQFKLDYLKAPRSAGSYQEALTRVREISRTLFVHTVRSECEQYFSLRVTGSDQNPDWFIRTHPYIRIFPKVTPILVVSAKN